MVAICLIFPFWFFSSYVLGLGCIWDSFVLDGGLKMRQWQNGGTHMNGQIDHLSTLSRPRSIEAISNGTLPNNMRTSNGIMSRGGLHEDIDFPTNANTKSLSRRKPIVWMRPHVCEFNH